MAGKVRIIVAIGKDGSIGKNGDLIWKISDDLKRFKSLTTGHPVIMGRKTWESLPKKPLPGRRNIILTRNKEYMAEGAEIVNTPADALEITKGEAPFIIGGAEVYKAFLPYADEIYLTEVLSECTDADARLEIDFSKDWSLIEESSIQTTQEGILYRYLTYRRR